MPEPWRERWHTLCSACVCPAAAQRLTSSASSCFKLGAAASTTAR